MRRYKLVPQEEYDRLRVLASELSAILERMADAPSMGMELPTSATTMPEKVGRTEISASSKKYAVGRGKTSWADVAAKELSGLFSLDEAMDHLMPLIDTDAKRPRDSLRVAMDRDDRFRRVDRGDGIWYQRVDPSQMDIEQG